MVDLVDPFGSAKESAKDVRKERIQRRHFQVAKAKQKESCKSFTSMYVVLCHQTHLAGMHTMFLLLMIFLERHGFIL